MDLTAENEKLKQQNIVIHRSRVLPDFGGYDKDALIHGNYYTGCPVEVLKGIRGRENGQRFLECGYHGKTKLAVEVSQRPEEEQYIAAGQLATRLAWSFCLRPENKREFLICLGKTYTGGPPSKYRAWASSVGEIMDER